MLRQTSRLARQSQSLSEFFLFIITISSILDILVSLFESWGISLSEKKFTPHMTLMKLSKSSHFHRQGKTKLSRAWNTKVNFCFLCIGIKKINPTIYEEWRSRRFGAELIDSIYLCNIREKQSDGFYKVESLVNLN